MSKQNTIKNGTLVICQTGGSHFNFGQVVDTTPTEYATSHDVLVTLESQTGTVARFENVFISHVDYKGIGWKVANSEDVRIADLYKVGR